MKWKLLIFIVVQLVRINMRKFYCSFSSHENAQMLHQDCWLIVKETLLSVDFYGESVIRDNLIPRKIPPPSN